MRTVLLLSVLRKLQECVVRPFPASKEFPAASCPLSALSLSLRDQMYRSCPVQSALNSMPPKATHHQALSAAWSQPCPFSFELRDPPSGPSLSLLRFSLSLLNSKSTKRHTCSHHLCPEWKPNQDCCACASNRNPRKSVIASVYHEGGWTGTEAGFCPQCFERACNLEGDLS